MEQHIGLHTSKRFAIFEFYELLDKETKESPTPYQKLTNHPPLSSNLGSFEIFFSSSRFCFGFLFDVGAG